MEAATLLYRSRQAALRNGVAHASASAVRVVLETGPSGVVLTIDDDGRGFSGDDLTERSAEGHVGLRALAGLVADAGGTATVRSTPGVGTRVQVSLPIAQPVAP